ncbi:uncharacterized protein LOC134183077 [Corticium candelabrum]|uniref:uncharacterized protein LOC134183077 n=1 Tax=Corticium candelabrum TaxID=121492 RepID=UPI002E259700|nr:uncharacterized protein LOC134183077 [Corticium candelabrum]
MDNGVQTTGKRILLAASHDNEFANDLKLQLSCELVTPREMQKFQEEQKRQRQVCREPMFSVLVFVFDHYISKNNEADIKQFRVLAVREAQKLVEPNSHVIVVLDGTSPDDLVQFDDFLSQFTNVVPRNLGVLQVARYVKERLNDVVKM